MSAVNPWSLDESDIELRAIGVWPSVGHAHPARPVVLVDEILVLEVDTIDAVSTSTIRPREVSTYTCIQALDDEAVCLTYVQVLYLHQSIPSHDSSIPSLLSLSSPHGKST